MTKKRPEDIFPLSALQQGLLLHSLQAPRDEGFLQVSCHLLGRLDPSLLRQAWAAALQRHPMLRASVHWEGLSRPVLLVHRQVELSFEEEDWSALPPEERERRLEDWKDRDRRQGFRLDRAPLLRVLLLREAPERHRLLWSCHHLLLDGWSAAVVLRDVFELYEALRQGLEPRLAPLPSLRSWLSWLKSRDEAADERFWKSELEGFAEPTPAGPAHPPEGNPCELHLTLDEAGSRRLQSFLREKGWTATTLLQGLWALLLARLHGCSDVVFGVTVSGRGAGLPNLERMAGMFMNVLPRRVRLREQAMGPWLEGIQRSLGSLAAHEHCSLDRILEWMQWPGRRPLFDSLLVVENFPYEDLALEELRVEGFEGGLTSTYPLTLVATPGVPWRLTLRLRSEALRSRGRYLLDQLEALLRRLPGLSPEPTLQTLLESLEPPPAPPPPEAPPLSEAPGLDFAGPRNPTELQLARIWSRVLGLAPIDVRADFFSLGGSSLLAVRLFAEIERQMGKNLPPVTLLQHPSIESLAPLLTDEGAQPRWDSLVPLQVQGERPPLFCVHGGGGHIFFYHPLAQRLAPDQPVYALQPVGLDGVSPLHRSIEEMATHYLREVRKVQPTGPVALLGYCQSTAVCHEMTRQLQARGEDVSLLALVDAAPVHFEPEFPPTLLERARGFWERFRRDPFFAVTHLFENRKRELEQTLELKKKPRQEQNLLRMQANLRRLFEEYHWRPHRAGVTFLRCGEFEQAADGDWFIHKWAALAGGGVEVVNVPGHHLTLFEEPEVAGLAEALRRCLERVQPS